MTEGSASIIINRPAAEVFGAVSDISRMGEWSPECTSGRWLTPAFGAENGAMFEGDNVAKLGPITLKRWTTSSEVTECVPNEVFEFVAEDHTTWRYELGEQNGSTSVTESFSHPPYTGVQGFIYGKLARREAVMVKGMQQTLEALKAKLEGSA